MYVKDIMNQHPVCISPETSISEAIDIMHENGFHRLPVVNTRSQLVGLLTEGTIAASTSSNTSSLSTYELNYLLNKTKVDSIMVKNVRTIHEDALLEEAASLMLQDNIGCLPVVKENVVIGIITQNDIFAAFIDILGYYQKGMRIVINVPADKAGTVEAISHVLASNGVNISNVVVFRTIRGIEVVFITFNSSENIKDELTKAGFNVTSVTYLDK